MHQPNNQAELFDIDTLAKRLRTYAAASLTART
jgi:hypothetical protein